MVPTSGVRAEGRPIRCGGHVAVPRVDRLQRDGQMPRKKRYVEPADERKLRLEKNVREHEKDARAAEDAIDEMVKRSIEKHGP